MNIENLATIQDKNTPLLLVMGYSDVRFLKDHGIDLLAYESILMRGFNSKKIQGACDGVLIDNDTDTDYSNAVDFAKQIGQPVFVYDKNIDKDIFVQNIYTTIQYPKQFMLMRLLHYSMYFLHVKKNKDYSPSNILGTGQAGIATRLWDKCARFMNLIGFDITNGEYREEKKPNNESILDTLIDAANYALIAIIHKFHMWGQ